MIDALRDHTYMVRHNPNCPLPFEVRTCGDGGFCEVGNGKNFVAYGKTADEAAAKILDRMALREWAPKFRELWEGL